MAQHIVIGTSAFEDTSIAAGPFNSLRRAGQAHQIMSERGWVAETVTLLQVSEIPTVTNDEGADL